MALFNARDGRVRIYTDAPIGEFQSVIDQFAGKVDFVGWSFVDYSRVNDVEPHWGGAKIKSSTRPSDFACTSGFSVLNANLTPRMVTADHCFVDGADVYSPQGTSFGVVKDRSQHKWPVDAELVGGTGIAMGPSIYVGGQTGQRDVYSGAAISTYVKGYCHSGAVTFENCGAQTIYDRDMDISGSLARNFEYPPGLGPCNGDSGAPVYRYYFGDVKIVGIIKGGANFNDPELGGNGDDDLDPFELDNCRAHSSEAWVTTWTRIQDAYNVTIKTI